MSEFRHLQFPLVDAILVPSTAEALVRLWSNRPIQQLILSDKTVPKMEDRINLEILTQSIVKKAWLRTQSLAGEQQPNASDNQQEQ